MAEEDAGKVRDRIIKDTVERFTADNDEARSRMALLKETFRLLHLDAPVISEAQLRRGIREEQTIVIGAVMGLQGRALQSFKDTIPVKMAVHDDPHPMPTERQLREIIEGASHHVRLDAIEANLSKEKRKSPKAVAAEEDEGEHTPIEQTATQTAAKPAAAPPAAERNAPRTISLKVFQTLPLPIVAPPSPPRKITLPLTAGATVPLTISAKPKTSEDPTKQRLREMIDAALEKRVGEGKLFASREAFDASLTQLYERFHALDTTDGLHKGRILTLGADDSLTLTPRQALVTAVALGFMGKPEMDEFLHLADKRFHDELSIAAVGLYPRPDQHGRHYHAFDARSVERALPAPPKQVKPEPEIPPVIPPVIEPVIAAAALAALPEAETPKRERKPRPAKEPKPRKPVIHPDPECSEPPAAEPAKSVKPKPTPAQVRACLEESEVAYKSLKPFSGSEADNIAVNLFNTLTEAYSLNEVEAMSTVTRNGEKQYIASVTLHTWRKGRPDKIKPEATVAARDEGAEGGEANVSTRKGRSKPEIIARSSDALAHALSQGNEAVEGRLANALSGIPWEGKKTPTEILHFIRERGGSLEDLIKLVRRQERIAHTEYASKLGVNSNELSRILSPTLKVQVSSRILNGIAEHLGITDPEDLIDFRLLARQQPIDKERRITQEKFLQTILSPEVQALPRTDMITKFMETLMLRHGLIDRGELADAAIAFADRGQQAAPAGEEAANRRFIFKQKLDNIIKPKGGITRLPADMALMLAHFALPNKEEAGTCTSFAEYLQEPGKKAGNPNFGEDEKRRRAGGAGPGTPG